MKPGTTIASVLLGGATLLAQPGSAFATDAVVTASSDLQLYMVPNPYGTRELRRRRFTQTLGLRASDLLDRGPTGAQLNLVTRLRLDPDFGASGSVRDPNNTDFFVPGFEEAPVDLMYAYLEASSLFGGWFGVRAGRQYVADVLGWWAFDGALAEVDLPIPLRVQVYGGTEERGGLDLLSTSRFTADGVYRGSREGLEANQWPSYLEESKPAPAYGFAVETVRTKWLHGRVGYRRVTNRDTVYITPFPDRPDQFEVYRGDRVSSERLGGALTLSRAQVGTVGGSAVYDFLHQKVTEHAASASWFAAPDVTFTASYDYYLPTFDGDSIFNWFSHSGMTTARFETDWAPSRRLDVASSLGTRSFRTEGDEADYASARTSGAVETSRSADFTTDALGSARGRYVWSRGSAEARILGEVGATGHRVGADLVGRRLFSEGLYDTLASVSLYDWSDDHSPERSATSFTYVLGGGLHPNDGARAGLEWEHSMNRLVGHRFRLLATLELELWL